MARLAFFSPLPPVPSGISYYSAHLLEGLGSRHEIDLYYDRRIAPPRSLLPALKRHPHDELIWRNAQNPYDLVVYQMGNSLHHAYMHPFVFQYPGLLVLHDLVVHHARGHVLLSAGRQQEYRDELEYCHPGLGRQVGDILAYVPSDFTCYQFPMNKLMVDVSLAVGLHTTHGVEAIREASPGKPVELIHMAVPAPPTAPIDRFGLHDAWPLLASFGFMNKEKRVDAILEAVKRLRLRYPKLRFLFVGKAHKHFRLDRAIRRMGLQQTVTVTGTVGEGEFQALLDASTLVLNLRYPSAREMSASLLRSLGAGRVTLVSDLIHMKDIPAEIAPRVALFDEADSIVEVVTGLLEDKAALAARGARAREFIDGAYRLDDMVADYDRAIAAAIEARASFSRPAAIPAHVRPLADRIRPLLPEGVELD